MQRQDYVPGGMVVAAPGGGDWYHQHFSAGREPLRVFALLGGMPPKHWADPGEETIGGRVSNKTGVAIAYRQEDPRIRELYREELAKEGAAFEMPEWAYTSA